MPLHLKAMKWKPRGLNLEECVFRTEGNNEGSKIQRNNGCNVATYFRRHSLSNTDTFTVWAMQLTPSCNFTLNVICFQMGQTEQVKWFPLNSVTIINWYFKKSIITKNLQVKLDWGLYNILIKTASIFSPLNFSPLKKHFSLLKTRLQNLETNKQKDSPEETAKFIHFLFVLNLTPKKNRTKGLQLVKVSCYNLSTTWRIHIIWLGKWLW